MKTWQAVALLLGIVASSHAVAQEAVPPEDEWEEDGAVEEAEWEEPAEEDYRVDTVLMSDEDLARVGGAAGKLDEEEMEALEYDDPTSHLQQVPSVHVRREDGFGLRPNIGIRGASSERSKKITLMEDGVLFAPAPYSAPAAYYFPIASRMVGVEVYKGPAAIQYGPHTVGGAVNWVSRPIPWDETAGADLNFGMYLTGKLHAYYGKSWDQFGFLLEGVQWQSDGYKNLDGGGDTGFEKTELMAKLRVNSDPASVLFHSLRLKLGYSREISNETYLGLTDEDFAANPDRRYAGSQLDRMDWDRTTGELRYRLEIGAPFALTAVAYRHDFERVWRKVNGFDSATPLDEILANPTGTRGVFYEILTGQQDSRQPEEALLIGTNARDFVSQGVQLEAGFRSGGDLFKNELKFGGRVHHDRIDRRHSEQRYDMLDGDLVVAGDDLATTNNRGSTLAYSGWVRDEIQFWRFALVPGLRAELVQGTLTDNLSDDVAEGEQAVLLPGVGAYFQIVEHLGLVAGVHRGFSPVAPGQTDDVTPELSTNYEAGLRFLRSESSTLLEAVGFFSDYRNLLGECTFSAGCDESTVDDQFNAGRVWIYGLETVASHRLEIGETDIPLRLAYTLTQTEFLTAFTSSNPQFGVVQVGDELPYVPEHQVSGRIGLERGRVGWNLGATYVSPMREVASQGDDGVRTDEQLIFDVLGSYALGAGFTAYLKVDNLTNARPIASRRPFGARPTRPLLGQVGLKWQLEEMEE